MKGPYCCSCGKALPIPSQSRTGIPSLAATESGLKAFIPPISAQTIASGIVAVEGVALEMAEGAISSTYTQVKR